MTPRTELGARLERAADELGSLAALAAETGVSEGALSLLIHGKRDPSRETETLLAAWAGVTAWVVNRWSRCDYSGIAFPSPKRRGGFARAERLTPERLREIGKMGADAKRWRPADGQLALPWEVA